MPDSSTRQPDAPQPATTPASRGRISPDDELMLLGLLSGSAMHGYQLNEVIEQRLPLLRPMRPSTAYSRLDRLAARGLVTASAERVGRRPERRVYELTEAGHARFLELLRENLRSAETPAPSADLGVLFSRALPRREFHALLRERHEHTAEQRDRYQLLADAHPADSPGGMIATRALAHIETELTWLDNLLDRDPNPLR